MNDNRLTRQKDAVRRNPYSNAEKQDCANKALLSKFEMNGKYLETCSNCDTKYPLLDVVAEIIIGILFFLDI